MAEVMTIKSNRECEVGDIIINEPAYIRAAEDSRAMDPLTQPASTSPVPRVEDGLVDPVDDQSMERSSFVGIVKRFSFEDDAGPVFRELDRPAGTKSSFQEVFRELKGLPTVAKESTSASHQNENFHLATILTSEQLEEFEDEMKAISLWFCVLNAAERMAALYSLQRVVIHDPAHYTEIEPSPPLRDVESEHEIMVICEYFGALSEVERKAAWHILKNVNPEAESDE